MQVDLSDEQAGSAYDAPVKGVGGLIVSCLCLGLALFHLYTAAAGPFYAISQRAIHIGVGMGIIFLTIAPSKSLRTRSFWIADALAGFFSLAITVYVMVHQYRILRDLGYADPTDTDTALGVLMLGLLMEACRRVVGWEFALLCLLFLVYGAVGPWLPGIFEHSGFSIETLISTSFLNPMGIYGSMTAISATTISIYVLFGSILLTTGGAAAFLKVALIVAGRVRGGAAQVAVVGSSIMGMVNGSAVANVATVGTMTIPLMKSRGYPAYFAGAVEAAASSGGQIMPPIMGAGAFVMAEILGVPYMKIAIMAIIPAVMYYVVISATIYFEARKRNLGALEEDMIPRLKDVGRDIFIFLFPLIFLLVLLTLSYTPRYSGFAAVACCIGVYAIARLALDRDGDIGTRLKDVIVKVCEGCKQGAKTIAAIGVMIAGSQIIVAVMGLTGVGVKVSEVIFATSQGNIYLGVALAFVVNLLLGLSLPAVPSYLITVAVVGPALINMGIEPVVVHMFSFYLACMSGLTPPVAATSFVAAGLAGAGVWKTSWCSCRLALAGYFVPVIFVFHPEILGFGTPLEVAGATMFGVTGCILIAAGFTGYWLWPLKHWQSALIAIGGSAMMIPQPWAQMVGTAMAMIGIGTSYLSREQLIA